MLHLTSPPPSPQHISAIDRSINRIEAPEHLRQWFGNYSSGHRIRLAQDLAIIDAHAPNRRSVVEVGFIPPILAGALAERDHDLIGIDIAPERFEKTIANLRCQVFKCNIEVDPLPLPDSCADLIVFNEVFEHLRINLIFTLTEIRRILKKDGIVILSTPNLRSLRGIKSFLVGGRSAWCCPNLYSEWSKLNGIGHMGHVREYTPRDVTEFLTALGFRCDTILFRGGGNSLHERITYRCKPSLRPFMSIIVRRAEAK